MAQPAKSEAHGNLAGQRTDGRSRDRIHTALLDVPRIIEPVLLLGKLLAAAPRSDNPTDAAQLVARHSRSLQARVDQRFFHRGDSQRDRPRHVLPVLGAYVAAFIEIDNFACHLNGIVGSVESCDIPHTANAVSGGFPEHFPANSIRADRSNSSNHNSTLHLYSRTSTFTYCVSIGCFYAFRGPERLGIQNQPGHGRGRGGYSRRTVHDVVAGNPVAAAGPVGVERAQSAGVHFLWSGFPAPRIPLDH